MIAAAAAMGLELMPWQCDVLDVALEVQSEEAGDPAPGDWAYDTVGVSVERQAGKTTLLRPLVVHRLKLIARARIWQTAQTRVHARRRWMDATDELTSSPLGKYLARKTGIGHEELRWRENNSTLEPFAPNGESLHGETPDLVLVDELWAFDAEQGAELRQAYRPGFTTKDAQAWLLSTAGTEASAWLNALRRRGRAAVKAGTRLRIAWFEHMLPDEVDGVPVDELEDEDLVRAVIANHPANGYTLRPASVWSAWEEMTSEDRARGRLEFLRAYGNRSTKGTRPRVYPLELWRRAGEEAPVLPAGSVGLAFEVDPEGELSSISTAARLPDGRVVVEVVDERPGAGWVAGRVLELLERHEDLAAVACNDAGPTRDVADVLELALPDDRKLMRVSERDFAAACVRVDRELREETGPRFLHRRDKRLDAACEALAKRRLGRSWAYARGDAPVAAFVAATVATWAADHAPEPDSSRFWIG